MERTSAARRRGIACILASAVVFGFAPVLTAFSYTGGNNGINMSLIRAALPLPVLFALAKGNVRFSGREALRCLVLGASLYAVVLTLYSSYATLPVGVATTIHFLYPLYVALFEALRSGRRPSAGTLAALALALGGCVLCAGVSGGGGSLRGVLLAAVSGLAYAAYIVLLERWPGEGMPIYKQMFGMSLVGIAACAAFGAATGRLTIHLTGAAWIAAACAALLVSVVGHGLFQAGERLSGGMDAAMFSLLEPISSFFFSAWLLGERLTAGKLIGCALILAALAAHESGEMRKLHRNQTDCGTD